MEEFDVAEREEAIFCKHMETTRLELEAELQAAVDRPPDVGTDGWRWDRSGRRRWTS